MIGLFSANVGYSFLLAHAASQGRTWLVLVLLRYLNQHNTTMPRPAFTWLVCDTAIRLNSTDLCHLIISSYYYSFFRAFERYFLTVNRKIFILFTFNAIMQIVKSKLHSFQI